MIPHWLRLLSVYGIAFGICSFLFAIVDILSGRRQRMPIMNIVWPLSLLWSGPLGLWFYALLGRTRPATTRAGGTRPGHGPQGAQPTWIAVLLATTNQIGMAAGFLASFPVNDWLVRAGIKERMRAPGYPPLPGDGPEPGEVRPVGPQPAGP